MENEKKDNKEQQVSNVAHWLPIGMCLGCGFGFLLGNLALGISIGMLFGVAVGTLFDNQTKKEKSTDTENTDEPKDNRS